MRQMQALNLVMRSKWIYLRSRLWLLELTLWLAGCCALGYCALSGVDAAITQASLARAFEHSRIATNSPARPVPISRTEHVDIGSAQPGARFTVRLEIPKIGLSAFVLDGVGAQTLRVGPGHVPGTSWPGQPGNVVIAGHRDTFFRPLHKAERCDEVTLVTTVRTYHYRVSSFEVTDPHDVNALRYHGKDELTLITCYPFSYIGPAPKRFVVHALPLVAQGECGLPPSSLRPAIPR